MDTYGDMVTLLLCFFVMLFSMSKMDESKWIALVQALNPSAVVNGTSMEEPQMCIRDSLKAYPLAGTLRCSFLLPLPHLFPVQCPQTGDPARRRTQQTDLLSGLNQQQHLILPHLDLFYDGSICLLYTSRCV